MQTIKKTWSGGRLGKVIIVLVAGMLTCALLMVCAGILGSFNNNEPTATPAELAQATVQPTETRVAVSATEVVAASPTPGPTDTPVPTDTPAPTNTPAPTPTVTPTETPIPTATPTLAPQDQLTVSVTEALGEGNRGIPRISAVVYEGNQLAVIWAIDDSLTEQWIKDGAEEDVKDLLKAIHATGLPVERVTLNGTFPLRDAFANVTETPVIHVMFTRATLDQINWDDLFHVNVYAVADEVTMHPTFR